MSAAAAEWRIRTARKTDRKRLESFSCAAADVAWEVEVERFIRGSVLEWAFEPLAKANDPRLLLLFDRKSRELVGLAAHERAKLQAGDGSVFDATKLEVAALSVNWQGRTFESGDRASDVLMSAVMTDVSARAPPRDARVFAVVHEQNLRSIALCNRHGLINDMSRPNPTYRRLITEHR